MFRYLIFVSALGLAGCANLSLPTFGRKAPEQVVAPVTDNPPDLVRPVARPDTLPNQNSATGTVRTGNLGMTVASLGSPAQPGLWLETPLVQVQGPGQVRAANGQTIAVTLIPIDGPASAGSRMSLQAMQALGLPLTELAEVTVIGG